MLFSHLLFQGFGLARLVAGLGGAWIGWLLVFGGLHGWFLFEPNLNRKDQFLAPEDFIIHKSMPMINLMGAAGTAFNEQEINELRKQPGIKAVAPFLFSQFQSQATLSFGLTMTPLTTDLFFEAVPDEFLELKTQGWQWRPETNALPIPIILSRDYLTLYNFGFARSQNLPQINEQLLTKIHFVVKIFGPGKEQEFAARIVGLSERINSILVPYSFLQWANTHFGTGSSAPSRLMVKVDSAAVAQVRQYLTRKNYQYNTDQLKNAQLRSTLRVLLYVIAGFGLLVLLLAFWLLALSFQLLIARNRESLQKLIWIGYYPGTLVNRYLVFILMLVALINLASVLFLAWGATFLTKLLTQYGFAAGSSSLRQVAPWMAVLSLAIIALNYLVLRRQIFRLGR